MFFGILGPMEVRPTGGDPVAVGGPRPRALLALLMLDAGRVVGTERLIDGLYGEDPPGDAVNALQGQVSRLRRKLGDGALVEFHPAGYRLAVDPETVDVHRFTRLAGEGHRALSTGDHALAASLLREALELWRGPALADVPLPHGTRLEELRVAAVEDRVEADLALGESAELVTELQGLVAEHPLRERLRGQLMRALSGAGRQAEALAAFEQARQLLADELGADPSTELAAVHLAVLRADALPRKGLPAQLTSFVGRTSELERIATLFGTARLVTLTGPGGAGKTRLAIEFGTREDRYETCFVDLTPTSAPVQAVLSALGLREAGLPQQDPLDRVVAALADRKLLLILDNCEHVIDPAARLAHDLLGACPDLRVLATSRESLGITGESLCPVPPLEPGPAVRLFADRAAAVRPGFEVDDSVRRICAALDGLPLAIELAAARLRSLTVAEIASRLDDRFALLSRGSRTVAPRHQTLRAVVEWSWDLLEPDEQELAGRLTVFAGGATIESAARVCGPGDVLDLLASLVDKSLVEVVDGRYRMLETIRAFCAEQLTGTEQVQRAHAEYFLDLAAIADPHLRRAEQLEWLARLTAEHANLQAALRWAVGADPRLALDLIRELSWYWYLRGVRGEIAPLAARLLEVIEPEPTEEYALCVVHGRVERALEVITTLTGPVRQPFVVIAWALLAGPPAAGAPEPPMHREVMTSTDPWFQALIAFSRGYAAWYAGGAPLAERECADSLATFRSLGERWGMAQALDALATITDDPARALALTDEALEIVGQLGANEELAELTCRHADRLLDAGDLVAAQADYHRAVELGRRAGVAATVALAHSGLGELARLRGDLAEARGLHELALTNLDVGWTDEVARERVLTRLAEVARSPRA